MPDVRSAGSGEGHRGGAPEVARAAPHGDLDVARIDRPSPLPRVPVGEGPLVEGELDPGGRPGVEVDLAPGDQLARRSADPRAGVADVALHDLPTGAGPGVGDLDLQRQA